MRPLWVTTPLPAAMASSKVAMSARASSTASAVGAQTAVGRLDLARVDERLAVEAHLAALDALGLEAVGVLDVVVDAVEDHLAGGPGGEQAQAEAGEQRLAAGHVLGVELLGQVVGAHDQHGEALGGGGDLLGVEHGDRRLDHGPDRGVVGGAGRPRGPPRWRRRRRPS